jgi:hypothetical protein
LLVFSFSLLLFLYNLTSGSFSLQLFPLAGLLGPLQVTRSAYEQIASN